MAKFWLAGAGIVALALLGAAVAIALWTRGEGQLPADSPEGVVQRFLQAIYGRQFREAYSYLHSEGRCSYETFVSVLGYEGEREESVALEAVELTDDRALVTVRFSQGLGPCLQEHSYRATFQLRREAGQWRITGSGPYRPWCPPEPSLPAPTS